MDYNIDKEEQEFSDWIKQDAREFAVMFEHMVIAKHKINSIGGKEAVNMPVV